MGIRVAGIVKDEAKKRLKAYPDANFIVDGGMSKKMIYI